MTTHDLTALADHPELLTELEWRRHWFDATGDTGWVKGDGSSFRQLSQATATDYREAGFMLVEKLGAMDVWIEPQDDIGWCVVLTHGISPTNTATPSPHSSRRGQQ